MASRLTDRRKKKIIADYVQTENYTATAKMNGVSPNTVKKLVQGNAETAAMLTQKRDENTKDILDYMDGKRDVVCQIIDKGLTALNDQERLNEASPSQITTAMGTLIDKFTLAEQRKAQTASSYLRPIHRLEESLTRCQAQKQRCIESLTRLRKEANKCGNT